MPAVLGTELGIELGMTPVLGIELGTELETVVSLGNKYRKRYIDHSCFNLVIGSVKHSYVELVMAQHLAQNLVLQHHLAQNLAQNLV